MLYSLDSLHQHVRCFTKSHVTEFVKENNLPAPHISDSDDFGLCFEWWGKSYPKLPSGRKLTLFFDGWMRDVFVIPHLLDSESELDKAYENAYVLRSWGPNIKSQMAEYEINSIDDLKQHFVWLARTCTPPNI